MNLKEKLLSNKILFANLFVFFIIFVIITVLQMNNCNIRHDFSIFEYHHDFKKTILDGRIPARYLSLLFIDFIPSLFHLNPNDVRSTLCAVFIAFSILFLCIIWVKSFFITEENKSSILFKIESSFLAILSFLCILLPTGILYDISKNYLLNMKELVVFFEYNFIIIFYFLFFIFLFNILFKRITYKQYLYILISINSFFCGIWSEHINVRILLCLLILIFILYFSNKKLLINRQFYLYCLIPFLIGTTFFFIFSDYILTNNMVAGHEYSYADFANSIKINFNSFFEGYVKHLFINDIFLYIILIILSISLYIIKPNYYKEIMILCYILLISQLLTSFIYILFVNIPGGFIYSRESMIIFQTIQLDFIILLMLGCMYCGSKNIIIKYTVNFFIIISIIFYFFILFSSIRNIVNSSYEIKHSLLKLDKITLVYNILGDNAILPFSIFFNSNTGCSRIFIFQDEYIGMNKTDFYNAVKKQYFDANVTGYSIYFRNQYNREMLGFTIVDSETAEKEYSKRLLILSKFLGDVSYLKLEDKSLLFTPLYKFSNIHLSINDLDYIEKNYDDVDKYIILKAKANIFFKQRNWDKAIDLYNRYIEKYPNDYNSLLNIAEIHLYNKNYNEAEKIYKYLITIDKENKYLSNKLSILTNIKEGE